MKINFHNELMYNQDLKKFLNHRLQKYYNKKILKRRISNIECDFTSNDVYEDWDVWNSEMPEPESHMYCPLPYNILNMERTDLNEFLVNNKKEKINYLIIGRDIKFDNDGYIAGGAIANLINEYYFGVPAKINDVDYFYYDHKEKMPFDYHEYIPDMDYDEDERIEFNEDNYMLLGANKNRKNNNIRILPSYQFSWINLLNSFDLNCTMAGFHPITNEIIFTSDFVDFLQTRTIKLKKPVKYRATSYEMQDSDLQKMTQIIRANKKKKELKAIYHFDDDIKKFMLSYEYFSQVVISNQMIRIHHYYKHDRKMKTPYCIIPKKEVNLLFQYKDILLPYFKIFRKNSKLFLRYLNPPSRNNELMRICYKNEDVRSESKMSQMNMKLEKLFEGFPLKEIKKHDFLLISQLINSGFDNIESELNSYFFKILEFYTTLKDDKKYLLNKYELKSFGHLLKNHISLFYSYVNYVISKKKNEFEFSYFLEIYRLINKHCDVAFIGLFESLIRGNSLFELKNPLILIENLKISYEKSLKDDLLCKPINISRYAKYCTELYKASLLKKEGVDLRHCVGGYSSVVKEGKSKIFDINFNGRSTIEYGVSLNKKNLVYSIRQHKSYGNSQPSKQNLDLAKLLLNYLNYAQYLIPLEKRGKDPIRRKQ